MFQSVSFASLADTRTLRGVDRKRAVTVNFASHVNVESGYKEMGKECVNKRSDRCLSPIVR